jgi:hypothetical protein
MAVKMLIILVGFHLVIYLDILNLVVGTVRPHMLHARLQ